MDKLEKILWEFVTVEDDIIALHPPASRDTSKMIKLLSMILRIEELKQQKGITAKS